MKDKIVDLLLDEDIRKYLLFFAGGLIAFILLFIAIRIYFTPKVELVFYEKEIEYQDKINSIVLIESVNGIDCKNIKDKTKGSMYIEELDLEITATFLDTEKLGEQEIEYSFNNGCPSIKKTFNILDKTAPKITIKKKTLDFYLEELEKMDSISKYYSVIDNCDQLPLVTNDFTKIKFEEGKKYKIEVVATDASKNVSKDYIEIIVKKKEVIKENEEEKAQTSQNQPSDSLNNNQSSNNTKPQSNNSQDSQQSNNLNSNNTKPSQKEENKVDTSKKEEATSKPQETPKQPKTKRFMFSDGYDMNTAYEACINEFNANGQNGQYYPLKDAEGIYIGYEIILY